jgi:hypothetical protein
MKRYPIETLDSPRFEDMAKRLFSKLPPRVPGGVKKNEGRALAFAYGIARESKRLQNKKG